MFFHFTSVKNFHNKPLLSRCFIAHKSNNLKNRTVIAMRPVFVSNNKIVSCLNSVKYLRCLLKKSKINDLEILRRSFSSSYCLFNQKKGTNEPENPENPNIFSILVSAFFITFFFYLLSGTRERMSISWEEFKNEMLLKGEVKQIVVDTNSRTVLIELHDGAIIKNRRSPMKYFIMKVPDIMKFEAKLREVETKLGIPAPDRIPVQYQSDGAFSNFLVKFLILAFLIGIVWRMASKHFKVKNPFKPMYWDLTKAKFTLVEPLTGGGKGVKFSDVAGLKEAKTEILDFVDYLKRPDIYRNLGARVPKGALLLGPPGCGKTLLAKAVATEANVPFLSMNGSEFIEILGGLGAARVRDLFKEAKRRSPCIIYIDEIDAIGKKRETLGIGTEGGEVEQTLNQLLVEMDGVIANEGVVLLASTNRASVLDAALLRPGRFDRQILIDLPTFEERREIFEQHLKSIQLEHNPKVYSKRMAHLTPRFSGADIANVCNEAALHAARLKKKIVQGEDLEYAVEKVVGGTEKRSSVLSPEERRLFAYYEAGRALIGWLSKYGEALLKITIVSRTHSAAGWTLFTPTEKFLFTSEELRGKMCMGLGGRVALILLFNRVTTAGEKDLKKVTNIAYAQIRQYGMNERFGLMSFDVGDKESYMKKPYSKACATLLDLEAKKLIAETFKECENILTENKDKLIKLAEELLVKETLNYDDVVKLIGPPLYEGKKLVEPLEFALSLDQAAGSEATNTDKSM